MLNPSLPERLLHFIICPGKLGNEGADVHSDVFLVSIANDLKSSQVPNNAVNGKKIEFQKCQFSSCSLHSERHSFTLH